MDEFRKAHFNFDRFPVSDLHQLTGLMPVALRDWRRRKLIPKDRDKEGNSFHLATIAELLLLKKLSNHHLGPKYAYGWTLAMAEHVFKFATDDLSAWKSADGWQAWLEDKSGRGCSAMQYMAIRTATGGIVAVPSLAMVMGSSSDVVTVVDLKALGVLLRERIGHPFADVKWQVSREAEVFERQYPGGRDG
jgi:hypothetical protein